MNCAPAGATFASDAKPANAAAAANPTPTLRAPGLRAAGAGDRCETATRAPSLEPKFTAPLIQAPKSSFVDRREDAGVARRKAANRRASCTCEGESRA